MKAYPKSNRPRPKPEEFQETIESNRINRPVPRIRVWDDYLKDLYSSIYPEDDDWKKRVLLAMFEFTDEEGAYEVLHFSKKYKIPMSTLEYHLKHDPVFKKCYDHFKTFLGLNQRDAVRNKSIDHRFPVSSMHVYDKEWADINKYHNDMQKSVAEAGASGIQFVQEVSRERRHITEESKNELERRQLCQEEASQDIQDKAIEAVATKDLREENPLD